MPDGHTVSIASPSASAALRPPRESVMDRFLRYAAIDTQSAEGRAEVPSTAKQLDLARLLADELRGLGLDAIHLTDHGIVYARRPGNVPADRGVPVVGFIAHVDTAAAVSGAGVKPIIHRDYRGGDIALPGDPSQVITVRENPDLESLVGDDLITTDGTTLLGSDDKAGIAEIMTMLDTLRENPEIEHGGIAIAFTPDEETMTGVHHFDVQTFGATVAYTVDGFALGEISNETWNARTATVTFRGVSTHPGSAKGTMVNSMRALADFLTRFPEDRRPETTDGREGFLHPYEGGLDCAESTLVVALRAFDQSELDEQEAILRSMVAATQARFPRVAIDLTIVERYRNIADVLGSYPELTELAFEAARRAGLTPRLKPLRGGSDGSILNFMGLPTPDLFTGTHNAHSPLEFNSRGGLEQSTATLVELVQLLAAGKQVVGDTGFEPVTPRM